MFTLFVAQLLGTLALIAIPAALVYWRNDGKLSVYKSYLRGMLHLFRVMGWTAVVFGALFTAFSAAALLGARLGGNFPWWSIFFGLGLAGLGYGIQRLMRFILRDEDWNNMFASKDR